MGQTYQEAIENSNIVSKTDIKGIITFVNDEFCKISGYTKEELLGADHNIVRHPDVPDTDFKNLWLKILDKQSYKTTVKNLCKNGSTVYLNTTITPILDENNAIKEFIAIRYDVTKEVELKKTLVKKDKELQELNRTLEFRVFKKTKQLKELNQTLEQRISKEIEKNEQKQKILFWQSRMASLGQMLANVAHQWRQPLTELNLSLYNLKKASKKAKEEEVEHSYKDCKAIILNMSNTIEDFTNFFNPDKAKQKFLIKKSINEAISIVTKLISKNDLNITLSFLDLKTIGVSNELSQVIINLIQNSNDAFLINEIKDKNIEIRITQDQHKNFAIITFKDNAGGIKQEILEKIYEPYFSTKHSSVGTGLGLFMSKMIIEKSLNGTMNAHSNDNCTIFTITIPQG